MYTVRYYLQPSTCTQQDITCKLPFVPSKTLPANLQMYTARRYLQTSKCTEQDVTCKPTNVHSKKLPANLQLGTQQYITSKPPNGYIVRHYLQTFKWILSKILPAKPPNGHSIRPPYLHTFKWVHSKITRKLKMGASKFRVRSCSVKRYLQLSYNS